MKKEKIKTDIWQELDDSQAELVSGGSLYNLQRLQQEFEAELARSSKPKEIVVVGPKID
ncbi:hypothetical protein ACE1B6_26965 [Aerosakkonemataceae cyanobacterium BLCC-F154]|uniref:Uncharacterized protein n=1 Tax=Floridaenema fluviatile BLCC-F154 TaxID=3153640 RepID=A0ABV4YK76_9CYAN